MYEVCFGFSEVKVSLFVMGFEVVIVFMVSVFFEGEGIVICVVFMLCWELFE